jgi:hypothetical protein
MRIQKAAVQAAAVKLSERADECFERADDQHKNADAQHASADKLEVLGTALEADAAKLFGETELHPPPAPLKAPVASVLPATILLSSLSRA